MDDYFPKEADMVTVVPASDDIGRYIEKGLKEDLDMSVMGRRL